VNGFGVTAIDFREVALAEMRQWWDSASGVAAELGVVVASGWSDRLEEELNARGVTTRDADGKRCASYAWWIDADAQDASYTGGHGPAAVRVEGKAPFSRGRILDALGLLR